MKRIIAVGIMLMSVLLTLSLHGAFAQNEISEEAAINESNNYVTQGYYLQGQEAIDLYDKAIQIYPQNFYAYYNKGATLIQLERYREAVDALNMALSIKSDDSDALVNKAVALIGAARSGQYTNAEAAYQKAIQACDMAIQLDKMNLRAYNNRGQAEWSLGELTQDRDILEEAFNDFMLVNQWGEGSYAVDAGNQAHAVSLRMQELGMQPPNSPPLGTYHEAIGVLG
jgi:tetratricopeptide (TPR) repeat protein